MAAGAQHGPRGPQLGARVGAALQLVEEAQGVVAAGEPVREPGEGAAVAFLDPAAAHGDLDALAGVEPVEGGVREELLGQGREEGPAGADVEPALGFVERAQRAGAGEVAPVGGSGAEESAERSAAGAADPPQAAEPAGSRQAAEALPVAEVAVVEGEAFGGEAGVLETVPQVTALVEPEGARLVLDQVGGAQPEPQPRGAAPGQSGRRGSWNRSVPWARAAR